MRRRHPLAQVEVWAQDEHRLGLKPVLRRVWAPIGLRPVARVRPRYRWLWVYGFVHPESGATEWLLLPRVSTAWFTAALAHFARAVGAGPDKQVVLVLDQAGWHTSPDVALPEGLHLAFLPAYSPELQPAERLWPLTNEGVANKLFATLEALEQAVARRVVALTNEAVRALTLFHWWPRAAANA